MKHFHKKPFFFIAIFLSSLASAFGADFTSKVANGNWNSPLSWTAGAGAKSSTPGADDIVTILSGHNITVSAAADAHNLIVSGTLNINSNLTFSKGGSVTVNNGGKLIFNSIAVINGGTGGPNGIAVTIFSGATLSTMNENGFSTSSSGSFARSAGDRPQTFEPGVNYIYNGTSAQNTGNAVTAANDLTVNNATGLTLTSSVTVNGTLNQTAGNITCNTPNVLTINGTHLAGTNTVGNSGTYALSNGATLQTESVNGVDGNIKTTTNTFASAASYVFMAPTLTPFSGTITSMANLTLGAAITLNKDVSVGVKLTLNSGLLTIPATRKLTLTNAANSIAGAGTTKYIVTEVNITNGTKGTLQVNGVGAAGYTFPVGNGGYYLPAIVAPSATGDYSITAFTGITANGVPATPLLPVQRRHFINAVWDVTGPNNVPATLSLSWSNSQELEGSSFQIADKSFAGISHYTGGQWDSPAGTYDAIANMVTRTGISSFSPFSITLKGEQSLPVKFANVKVSKKATGVQLDFTNLTETGVNYYDVEYSTDGILFNSVKRLMPEKNDNSSVSYKWLDVAAREGKNIYRVKAVENTENIVYSNVMAITMGAGFSEMKVHAGGGYVSTQVTNLPAGKYKMQIFTVSGQLVSTQEISHPGGLLSHTTLLKSVKTGLYIYNIDGPAKMQKKFIVQ